eukprot:6365759-Alexandrium_andersonii.AAC.1
MEDLPSAAPPPVKWKPTEVESPWAPDAPGSPDGEMLKSSLESARVGAPFVLQNSCVVGL